MRTRTLVLAAAALAAGMASSLAQVYSQNVVGYVNITVDNSLKGRNMMLHNPLKASPDNTITNVLTGVYPDSTTLIIYKNGAFADTEQYFAGFGWFPGTTPIPPGQAFSLNAPNTTTFTFVGDVLQGSLSNYVAAGNAIVGSLAPVAQPLGATGTNNTLELPPVDNANVIFWKPSLGPVAGNWDTAHTFNFISGYGWFDANDGSLPVTGPTVQVAQAFLFQNPSTGKPWVRTFTVQ